MSSTPTNPTPDGPNPALRPGAYRLHERLGTTRTELLQQVSGSPARLALARLIAGAARDADALTDALRSRIGHARDNLGRLGSGGRLTVRGSFATVMATLGAEIDLLTGQLDQALEHLDELIDAYERLTEPPTPTASERLRILPGPRRYRTAGPCTCACTRPCGCGHAGCTAR
ncbi:hypothetical protein [Streptacidiphilus sp. MAP5-3]|uniref:hypothetical protein n=1 Tax=unclassified Streptacidiphilus TaxID=2643834 RepID=UPI0035189029